MKIIIPVAGIGSRLAPHTYTIPKALVHVAGKEMLAHILDKIKDLEVSEVVFVVGYLGDQIIDYVKKNYSFNSQFIIQKERKGLGHAIYLAMQKFSDFEEPVMIMLGDTLFEMDIKEILKDQIDGVIVTSIVENPERFGVVIKKDNRIMEFVEKPEKPVSNRAIVGIYYIKNTKMLFECLKFVYDNNIKTRGEYQLTDALEIMLKRGATFNDVLCDKWLDCGKPETLLSTNKELLDIYFKDKEYKFKNCVLIKPVAIAEGVKIENSVIGPFVSIAKGVRIKNSILKNCIINEDAYIENAVLEESLIGHAAVYKNRYIRVNIGDSSEFTA
ncbi:MAG: sugar phosphate nucleotidyltransferase [Candidatus Muirbacterium halophilum]|nr:sugar phosphate nucleotidyltransferase [Candidatus Muirbacterium halophilum]MCK9476433.1 sugar phosphate nucleotidyltransferase [Candidatus Muirbacterium halophilum]